jgi:protein-tyrosine phosphatase
MHEWALDISAHRSRSITDDIARTFDLILVMEEGHREALCIEFPDLADRIYRLSDMAGQSYDIPDPISGPIAEVRAVAHEMDAVLQQGFERIVEHARHADVAVELDTV